MCKLNNNCKLNYYLLNMFVWSNYSNTWVSGFEYFWNFTLQMLNIFKLSQLLTSFFLNKLYFFSWFVKKNVKNLSCIIRYFTTFYACFWNLQPKVVEWQQYSEKNLSSIRTRAIVYKPFSNARLTKLMLTVKTSHQSSDIKFLSKRVTKLANRTPICVSSTWNR